MLDQVIGRVIETEVQHRQMQIDYFAKREKVGPTPAPTLWQPKMESEKGKLVAVFVEPGAAHLVFGDEVAPAEALDIQYREVRLKIFGRTHDVESVEVIASGDEDVQVRFVGNFAFLNVYESSLHWTGLEPYKGNLFSETWNHMLSAGGKWVNMVRGGYRKVEVPVLEGDRAAAEGWSPSE
ncbi:hypothetical protein LCGC14_2057150 [marine sediment metagenome]|uniref:Uncharacterized protein n=1 Tax=marine sediment metagenome TaxID=412755 RepID=A0A0F9EM82_9ZZZZ